MKYDYYHISAEIHLIIIASRTMKKFIISLACSPNTLNITPKPVQNTIRPEN